MPGSRVHHQDESIAVAALAGWMASFVTGKSTDSVNLSTAVAVGVERQLEDVIIVRTAEVGGVHQGTGSDWDMSIARLRCHSCRPDYFGRKHRPVETAWNWYWPKYTRPFELCNAAAVVFQFTAKYVA